MIHFTCPECNATLRATDERAGTRFKCGKCGSPVRVPAAAALQAPAPASAVRKLAVLVGCFAVLASVAVAVCFLPGTIKGDASNSGAADFPTGVLCCFGQR
jgi:hypothetical protein